MNCRFPQCTIDPFLGDGQNGACLLGDAMRKKLFGCFLFIAVTLTASGWASAADRVDEEKLHWNSIQDSTDIMDFYDYLRRYPGGRYESRVLARLSKIYATRRSSTKEDTLDGTWQWEITFDSSARCHGFNRFEPFEVYFYDIRSKFYLTGVSGMFNVTGKIDKTGGVKMYAAGENVMADFVGRMFGKEGGGRVNVNGDGVLCVGDWRVWR